MKIRIAGILMIAIFPFAANAQFGKLVNKIKNKVDQRVDNKIDKGIDQSLDRAEGKSNAAPDAGAQPETTATEAAGATAYSKYDFIAGEQIVYFEDFEKEALAELPAGWNTNGSGEVVRIKNLPGKWLQLHQPFIYLGANQKQFGDDYTIEFDVIMQLKNNGWMYPTFSFGLFSANESSASGNNFLKEYPKYAAAIATIYPGEFKSTKIKFESFKNDVKYFESDAKAFGAIEKHYGKPVHVAIQVQKERFRIWIDEAKAFDIPKAIPQGYKMDQLLFKIGQTNYSEEQYGMYVGNIKAAEGMPDTRHKLVEEGRFSTTGILFDVNAATIRPESNGVLNEIAAVLDKFPDLRVMVVGHTDADGNEKTNLILSEQRAAAVKAYLQTMYAIKEDRITTSGKGESQPAGDNKTREGKARNRRVEFIKQ